MLGLKDKGKSKEQSQFVEEENDESNASVDSEINTTNKLQVSGDLKDQSVTDVAEPHMSFAPRNSGIPTEGSDFNGFTRKLSSVQHRQSIDSGHYGDPKK